MSKKFSPLAELIKRAQPKIEEVEVEGIGPVRLRLLDGNGMTTLSQLAKEETVGATQTAKLLSMSLVNEEGVAELNNEEGVKAILSMDGEIIKKLQDEVMRINKLRAEDQEEVAKNSETTQTEDSTSVSP